MLPKEIILQGNPVAFIEDSSDMLNVQFLARQLARLPNEAWNDETIELLLPYLELRQGK